MPNPALITRRSRWRPGKLIALDAVFNRLFAFKLSISD